MKIIKLHFQSKEIVSLDSSSDEDVICLDDLPKKRRKLNSSETCPDNGFVTIKIFATALPESALKNDSNLKTVSTKKTLVEITEIKCLARRTLVQESNYFRALFSTKYSWRETNKSTIEVEVPGLFDIDLLGEERNQVVNIGGFDYVTKLESELLKKAVDEFFHAFIMMELEITAKNMLVFHRLSDFFLLDNFTFKIEEFIFSKMKLNDLPLISRHACLATLENHLDLIALYNFNPLLCEKLVPKLIFHELNSYSIYVPECPRGAPFSEIVDNIRSSEHSLKYASRPNISPKY